MPDVEQGREQNVQPIEITLDPLQLMLAALAGYARGIRGGAYEQLPRGYITYRDFTPALELRALDYWLHFGEAILITQADQSFLIHVPSIYDILLTFSTSFKERQAPSLEAFQNYIKQVALQIAATATESRRSAAVMTNFSRLSVGEQREGMALFRHAYAGIILVHSLSQPTIDACAQILPSLGSESLHRRFWIEQRDGALSMQKQFPIDAPQLESFFDDYYWEDKVFPDPDGPNILQFLPRPPRPERQVDAEDDLPPIEPAVAPPPIAVDEDAVKIVPKAELGKRYALYRTLGCKQVVRPKKVFGKEEHNYFGYLIKTQKGTWLIVVDCDTRGHAAYICIIDPNDPFRWIIDVQKPRMELRRIEARRHQPDPPEDEAPTYVGREFHDETFEQRMMRRYEQD